MSMNQYINFLKLELLIDELIQSIDPIDEKYELKMILRQSLSSLEYKEIIFQSDKVKSLFKARFEPILFEMSLILKSNDRIRAISICSFLRTYIEVFPKDIDDFHKIILSIQDYMLKYLIQLNN